MNSAASAPLTRPAAPKEFAKESAAPQAPAQPAETPAPQAERGAGEKVVASPQKQEKTLANTGVSGTGLVLGAAPLLLLAGAATLIVRRRASEN
ncbi:MAG TPA: hypothetical protein H9867_06375 [Candidatus Corynebacterium gallistercoris]|uniref:Uncharacterized protein n=1 Tax=Candidatus Corynebacterium gallistercoris TaxID=2838530 RepID=A0A9D1UQ49_9CORY|nr:hypothetical protein [Candidatus Corynebacterium gallistercoris]